MAIGPPKGDLPVPPDEDDGAGDLLPRDRPAENLVDPLQTRRREADRLGSNGFERGRRRERRDGREGADERAADRCGTGPRAVVPVVALLHRLLPQPGPARGDGCKLCSEQKKQYRNHDILQEEVLLQNAVRNLKWPEEAGPAKSLFIVKTVDSASPSGRWYRIPADYMPSQSALPAHRIHEVVHMKDTVSGLSLQDPK